MAVTDQGTFDYLATLFIEGKSAICRRPGTAILVDTPPSILGVLKIDLINGYQRRLPNVTILQDKREGKKEKKQGERDSTSCG